jgi:hypothetical protein
VSVAADVAVCEGDGDEEEVPLLVVVEVPLLLGGAGLHRGGELSRASQEMRAILRAACEGGEGACASFTLPPPPEVDEGRVRGTLRRLKALVWSEGDE